MTITQLEYIIALDSYRNFALAADKCFVTQPTLSMQVQKLEDFLGVQIFDRNKKPIEPTELGIDIIMQARQVVHEHKKIQELIKDKKGVMSGNIHIGVIPTIGPYLIPQFLINFIEKYPEVILTISELTTAQIIEQLKLGMIDCGILATPIHEPAITEIPLYWEPLVAYVSKKHSLFKKSSLSMGEIDINEVWLLNEGHCLRNQVINFCHDLKKHIEVIRLDYQTGSVETLKKIVELGKGITILPELAIQDFNAKQIGMVRYFKTPEPSREVGIVVTKNYVKKRIIDALKEEILAVVPEKMKHVGSRVVLEIM
ncbi:MAG: LysR substrate-binding domain-containing protein [Bacteroidota bacterium]